VGSPTIETFKTLLKMNAIRNCPVTTEDVNIAEKIFGSDVIIKAIEKIAKDQGFKSLKFKN
jgi:hypothetical protein